MSKSKSHKKKRKEEGHPIPPDSQVKKEQDKLREEYKKEGEGELKGREITAPYGEKRVISEKEMELRKETRKQIDENLRLSRRKLDKLEFEELSEKERKNLERIETGKKPKNIENPSETYLEALKLEGVKLLSKKQIKELEGKEWRGLEPDKLLERAKKASKK